MSWMCFIVLLYLSKGIYGNKQKNTLVIDPFQKGYMADHLYSILKFQIFQFLKFEYVF